jgi:predicted Zn-dependent peptidase
MKSLRNALALIFCIAVSAPAAEREIEYVEYDLDNGLHVILHEDHTIPMVAVTMMYHVGSKNENPARTGFAHFFEHLLFEGSKHIDRGEFTRYVKNAGGSFNANTSFDRTFYYQILPSNQLELGLWLESERLMHAKIDQVGVDTQREVVKEERRQRQDNTPYGSIIEEVLKRAYKKHPYQWAPIGSMEHLNQATLEEFTQFYKTFYVPNNAVLSIAGDIDIEETKALIDGYFSEIPRGADAPRPQIVEPPLGGEIRDIVYDNIQLPAVVYAYRIPEQGHKDYYAVDMLLKVLSQGQSSRLNKSVKDDQQKAVFVGAFPFGLEDPGLSVMFAVANVGVEPEALETAIDAEIEKVQQELIDEREFQKLKNLIETEYVNSNTQIRQVAENLANFHMYYGDAALIDKNIERYLKVTRKDLKRAANQFLTKDNRVVLHYLPKSAQAEQEKSE